jgi:deoxyribonuclease-4
MAPEHSGAEAVARVVLPDGRRAGPHLPLGIGLRRVPERACEIGASALQLFSDNPTAWRRRVDLPPDLPAFRRRLAELDIAPLAIHAAYLVNLAGPNDDLFGKSVAMLRHELTIAPAYGARFVNVHAGSQRGAGLEAGIARLVEGIAQVLAELPEEPPHPADSNGDPPPLLVIENASGGGDTLGVTVDELARILDAAAARGLAGRLAFCLDTAHLWGAGHDISDPATVDALVERFGGLIGLDRLVMIHLNDTHSALGSRHDRHAHIGGGCIGSTGLARFLLHPSLARVTFLLETPGMEEGWDLVNMARLGDLAAGRPLTPGPAPRDGAS